MDKVYFNIREAAEYLNCCRQTIYNLKDSGKLKFFRKKGSFKGWFTTRTILDEYRMADLEVSTEKKKAVKPKFT